MFAIDMDQKKNLKFNLRNEEGFSVKPLAMKPSLQFGVVGARIRGPDRRETIFQIQFKCNPTWKKNLTIILIRFQSQIVETL